MSYDEIGYNQYLEKTTVTTSQELSSLDIDSLFSGLDGEKIIGVGTIASQDGNLSMNLGESLFSVNDGTIDRVRLGKFDDGEYGLRIIDRDGNVLFDVTGTNNVIKSADGSMKLDLSAKQLTVSEGPITRVLIGYQKGGF